MDKPFYKSKKFVYALSSILVFVVLAVLPSVLTLEPETTDMIKTNLPFVFVFGLAVIGGHTLSDAIVLAGGFQIGELKQALQDLIDSLPLENLPPQIVNAVPVQPGETDHNRL